MVMEMTVLNTRQAAALEAVFTDVLRPAGLDAAGDGIHSVNLHADASGPALAWWYDDEPLSANGVLDGQGHGLVWLRRTETVSGPHAV